MNVTDMNNKLKELRIDVVIPENFETLSGDEKTNILFRILTARHYDFRTPP